MMIANHPIARDPWTPPPRRGRRTPAAAAAGRIAAAGKDGFTLIEILIVVVILGILAAIVVPQFSNAALVARENTLKDELRYLRTQVLVYKAQHMDVAPGYPGGNTSATPTESDFVDQMTEWTDTSGGTSATMSGAYKLGPYLSKMPANPINGLATILIVADGDSLPAAPANAHGWIYQAKSQTFLSDATGTDRDGVRYFDY
jgi:general secretion pathway protein G